LHHTLGRDATTQQARGLSPYEYASAAQFGRRHGSAGAVPGARPPTMSSEGANVFRRVF
jgi:hypothetical protein